MDAQGELWKAAALAWENVWNCLDASGVDNWEWFGESGEYKLIKIARKATDHAMGKTVEDSEDEDE